MGILAKPEKHISIRILAGNYGEKNSESAGLGGGPNIPGGLAYGEHSLTSRHGTVLPILISAFYGLLVSDYKISEESVGFGNQIARRPSRRADPDDEQNLNRTY